ncbi:EcsC family protein, partial [Yersinia pestis]
AHFVSPDLTEKVSNYFYDRLNQFSNQTSSVDAILSEAGAKDLEELTQDVDRSKRISQALGEQNKWIATVQGAVSGASGMLGTAIDIPASLLM